MLNYKHADRFMGHGIESEKWEFVFNEIIRVLKPNGWMELVEADNEIYRPGPITKEFNQRLIDIMVENKQDPYIGRTLKERLLKMDQLTQVSTMFVSCPGGQWAGKVSFLFIILITGIRINMIYIKKSLAN